MSTTVRNTDNVWAGGKMVERKFAQYYAGFEGTKDILVSQPGDTVRIFKIHFPANMPVTDTGPNTFTIFRSESATPTRFMLPTGSRVFDFGDGIDSRSMVFRDANNAYQYAVNTNIRYYNDDNGPSEVVVEYAVIKEGDYKAPKIASFAINPNDGSASITIDRVLSGTEIMNFQIRPRMTYDDNPATFNIQIAGSNSANTAENTLPTHGEFVVEWRYRPFNYPAFWTSWESQLFVVDPPVTLNGVSFDDAGFSNSPGDDGIVMNLGNGFALARRIRQVLDGVPQGWINLDAAPYTNPNIFVDGQATNYNTNDNLRFEIELLGLRPNNKAIVSVDPFIGAAASLASPPPTLTHKVDIMPNGQWGITFIASRRMRANEYLELGIEDTISGLMQWINLTSGTTVTLPLAHSDYEVSGRWRVDEAIGANIAAFPVRVDPPVRIDGVAVSSFVGVALVIQVNGDYYDLVQDDCLLVLSGPTQNIAPVETDGDTLILDGVPENWRLRNPRVFVKVQGVDTNNNASGEFWFS